MVGLSSYNPYSAFELNPLTRVDYFGLASSGAGEGLDKQCSDLTKNLNGGLTLCGDASEGRELLERVKKGLRKGRAIGSAIPGVSDAIDTFDFLESADNGDGRGVLDGSVNLAKSAVGGVYSTISDGLLNVALAEQGVRVANRLYALALTNIRRSECYCVGQTFENNAAAPPPPSSDQPSLFGACMEHYASNGNGSGANGLLEAAQAYQARLQDLKCDEFNLSVFPFSPPNGGGGGGGVPPFDYAGISSGPSGSSGVTGL